MSIYTMLLGFSIIIGVIVFPTKRRVKFTGFARKEINMRAVYCVVFSALIILLIGLRSSRIGPDTPGYYSTYSIIDLSFDTFLNDYISYLKIGVLNFFSDKNTTTFRFILSLFKGLGFSFNACLIIFAAVYVVPVFYLISKDSESVWKSCFWYLVFSLGLALSGIRITVAIGLTAISYICLLKHRRILSVVLFVFAVVIHLSAIIFIAVFFFERLTITRKTLYYIIPAFLLSPILGRLLTPVLLRYTYYQGLTEVAWNLPIYLFYSMTTVLLIWYSTDEHKAYHKMMVLGTVMCGLINYGAFGNTHRYFTQYMCICLPSLMNNINNKPTRIVVELLYFVVGIYLFMRTFSAGTSLVPYRFFWQ